MISGRIFMPENMLYACKCFKIRASTDQIANNGHQSAKCIQLWPDRNQSAQVKLPTPR